MNTEFQLSPVFIEIYVRSIDYYSRLLQDVFGFSLIRYEPDKTFAKFRLKNSIFLLNNSAELNEVEGHPFYGQEQKPVRGLGVEIGISVGNIEDIHRRASVFEGLKVTSIELQYWGLRDFRCVTPDGYYFRITEIQDAS